MNLRKSFPVLLYILLFLLCAEFLNFTFVSNSSEKSRLSFMVGDWEIPPNLDFAGEPVPATDNDIRERLEREMLVNTYWHSSLMLNVKRAGRWFPVIEPVLKKNGIPDDFKYLAVVESGLDNEVVSNKSAAGMWQFLEETARKYGLVLTYQVDERYHVEKATGAACLYIREARATLGNWTAAAAAYNVGIDGMKERMQVQHATSYYDMSLNSETGRFVYRMLALKEIMNNTERYGFMILEEDRYKPYVYKELKIDSSIQDLAAFAEQHNTNYKMLRLLNPWLRRTSLKVEDGKNYVIRVPG